MVRLDHLLRAAQLDRWSAGFRPGRLESEILQGQTALNPVEVQVIVRLVDAIKALLIRKSQEFIVPEAKSLIRFQARQFLCL